MGGLLVNVSLSLAVTVGTLALAEAVARRLERRAPTRALADTRGLDWAAEWQGDFYVMKSSAVGWPPWEDFNRDGLRDRRHPLARPEGTYRLVCLGDSVTLGYGFTRDEAWPQALQRLVDARGPGVEVFNVAVMGWSTLQERYAYERIARRYRPDGVVLAIVLNDLEDLQNNLSQPPRLLSALFRRSALVRRVMDVEGREIASVDELFVLPEPPRVGSAYARMFAEIRRLRDEVRADGARLTVMVLPVAEQTGGRPPSPVPQDRIAAFARAEDVALLDPRSALAPLGPSAYLDRLHFTPPGSARVAEAVLASSAIPAAACTTVALRAALAASAPGADPATVPGAALAALMSHPDPAVRRQAAWALGRRGPAAAAARGALRRALGDPDAAVRAQSARALAAIGPPARAASSELFARLEDSSEDVRWAAADALAASGAGAPEDLPRLVRALGNDDTYVRGFAEWMLAEAGPALAAAAPALEARLRDPDPGVRTLAVRALGNLQRGDPAAVAGLAEAVLHGTDDGRWRAARALAKLGPAAAPATVALARALSDPDEKLRKESALALASIGPPAGEAVPALVAAQRDSVPAVREAAGEAIRQITATRR